MNNKSIIDYNSYIVKIIEKFFFFAFLCDAYVFSYICFLLDLEISDFVNRTPSLNMRTPGQLLSLTSHLSFGSGGGESTHNSVISSDACENLLDELKETCMICS